MEIRFKALEAECRNDGSFKIGGYVNVTERESELLYSGKRGKWFNEVVKQGAFKRSLDSGKNIPLLLEHDYEKRLADTSMNNLTLVEDQIGLRFDAEIRDKEVYNKILNKEINNCSFGFLPIEQEFEDVSDMREKRYLKDLELLEISLVQNPAYAGSLVETRNMNAAIEKALEIKEDEKVEEINDEPVVEEEPVKEEVVEEPTIEIEEDVNVEEPVEHNEKRGFVEEQINKAQEVIDGKDKNQEVIDEIIKEKEQQLENAECMEEFIKEDLEFIKEYNREEEKHLEAEVARRGLEVLRLRVQLIKLKSI
ncbi:MAG: HK97 family phage prohead protease [Clostridia bacterium]|nr:HK97 family phage prohead protease [Romboutsia sp.]MBO5476657.1 HK97 family phage prohead protease [Clostridia bacterium]MBP3905740.1 HK97 family phage prohead protease [Peptostreptococcaceae bacterium]MBP3928117.1 HK97 family phage prohead protease [Peptostreptococcaceae bacterium]